MAELIRLEGITKRYFYGEIETEVLHGIDLTIHEGEFVAIMGASGSGKSTLMNILGCLDKPSSGRYFFQGQDVAQFDSDALAKLRREAFGFVFQSYHLLAGLSALQNVEMPATYSGLSVHQRKERAEQLLAGLGLADRMQNKPNQLSGGQQQRVSIARALMNGGQIILADEPTGALDSKSGQEVMALLKDLSAQGHTIILITHDAKVAAHADRLIEIKDGHVIRDDQDTEKQKKLLEPSIVHGKPGLWDEIWLGTKTALHSLTSNLFRTILTLLGIVIGVAAVISMLAIGDGAKQAVVDQISAMGSNLLLVRPGGPNQRGGRWNTTSLVPADVDALNRLEDVIAIPELQGSYTIRYGAEDMSSQVDATSYLFPAARQWQAESGSFFNQADEDAYATVAVLGQTVKQQLFGDKDPIGEYIIVNNILFQVIGVMEKKGASPMGDDQDDVVFVPYTTGSLRIMGQTFLRNVTIAVQNNKDMSQTQDEAHSLLLARHGTEDFRIFNMAALIATVSEAKNTITFLLGSIAAISLFVGGIGVMNIMLVSVTERTKEIGIRMATGARTRHILQQFLIEALVVSALGGVVGVVLGLLCTATIGFFGLPVVYSVMPVVLAFSCAFLTGLIFGFLPARKAAQLDPVAALAAE